MHAIETNYSPKKHISGRNTKAEFLSLGGGKKLIWIWDFKKKNQN